MTTLWQTDGVARQGPKTEAAGLTAHLLLLGTLVLNLLVFSVAAVSGLATAAENPPVAPVSNSEVKKSDRTMPPPRDPNVAVREEFDLAKARGTVQAWQLFIDRHPEHPLAGKARKQLDQLRNSQKR